MRIVVGPIPNSETFDARVGGWTPLPERSPRQMALAGFGLAMPLIAFAVVLFLAERAQVKAAFRESPLLLAAFVIGMLALVPAHELVHALAYLKSPRSRRLIVGAWPRHGMLYALYDGPMPRGRVLLMLAAPLLVLSVTPLFMLGFGVLTPSPAVRAMILFAVLNHAALCVGDYLLVSWRILRNVPRGALIRNDGWTTYWAPAPGA